MSRRAIKRYERRVQHKSSADWQNDQNDLAKPNVSSDEDDARSFEQPSPVKTKQSLFALLGTEDSDPEDESANDDKTANADNAVAAHDEEQKPQPPSDPSQQANTATKKKKRRKRKGRKRNDNPSDPAMDPDWIALNEDETQRMAEAAHPQTAGYIPPSYFSPSDDNEVREEAHRIMTMVENMVLSDGNQVDPFAQTSLPRVVSSLVVEPKLLSADAELKRLFGAKVVESERRVEEAATAQASRHRVRVGPRAHLRRKVSLVSPRDTWPDQAPGLIMRMDTDATDAAEAGLKYFRYAHEASYTRIQDEYRALVNTHDPNFLAEFSMRHPYHVDALLQLAELYRQMGELDRAGEWIERCMYILEGSWSLTFKPFDGSCRIRFEVLENRSLYIAIFRYSQLLTRRGLHRTALEMSKLLLNFDPVNDPMGMLMLADSYALLSGEYQWIEDMRKQYHFIPIEHFPNFAVSAAVAKECLRLGMTGISNRGPSSSKGKKSGKGEQQGRKLKDGNSGSNAAGSGDGGSENAEEMLIDAILTFPMVVKPILTAVQDRSNVCLEHQLFDEPWYSDGYEDGGVLMRISRVYAERSKLLWNSSHNKDLLIRSARRAGELDTAAGMGKDGVTGLLSSAFVSDEVVHARVARCRKMRRDAAAWWMDSGLYRHVQIADFADSTTNLPAEILVGDGAEQAVGAQRPRDVSVARGALEFLQSLLPWREARDARDDDGQG